MTKQKRWLPLWFLIFLMMAACAVATEDLEEVELNPQPAVVYILSPIPGASYDSGNCLHVKADGYGIASIRAEVTIQGKTYSTEAEGDRLEATLTFEEPATTGTVLKVTATSLPDEAGQRVTVTAERAILSPREELIQRMIDLAEANSHDKKYQFARAEDDWDIGVCKNFVMRLFDTFSKEYRMAEYPKLELHMPKNNSKAACAPYDYGIEWRIETAAEGSPFEIAAQFKYDDSLSYEENLELAKELVRSIRKGDFFQIVGYYGGGNGPHSMYIIRDYDPETREIHWTDSNMKGTRIDGARWGYMQFDADADEDWWAEVFTRKKRGATVYRLREDLYKY